MFESLKIGRPFGITLSVHGTFWLLPAFVLFSGAVSGGLDKAVLDVAVLLTIFGCVALHELGHALAARGFGIRTRDITLYPIGGVARLERMPRRPWQEIVVALAGPAVNVGIAAGLAGLMVLDGYPLHPAGPFESVGDVFWNRVLWGNIVLVLFNLLPAFPMDGGRVLRALAAMVMPRAAATALAANVGAGFAALFALYAILGGGGVMMLVLAFFLFTAGRAELASVRAEEYDRRYAPRADVPVVSVFGVPVARPLNVPSARPADGWEFDPRRRVWVEWRDGHPVRVMPAAD